MDTVITLAGIRNYIEQKGFVYDYGIVESLFLALKTKPYVLIGGKSGSGKTSLFRLFAESLGATAENGRYKQITPQADWSSSSALLGHINTDGKYIPGLIVPFIQEAISNPELSYFLCIDDINIARVDQYMEPLLSAMETRRFDEEGRIITDSFFDKAYFGIDLSASFSFGSVYLPDNLYIAGTVNADENSYPLSTRVLDRMFVIDLDSDNLAVRPDYSDDETDEELVLPPDDITNDFLKSDYLYLSDCEEGKEFICDYTFRLQHINQYIKHFPFSLSYRSRDEIIFYALYAKKYDVFDHYTMDDFVILQKILPRIHGSGRYLKMALSSLFKLCLSREGANMDEYADTSSKMHIALQNYGAKYPRCGEKITLMMRRLEEDGYTSFWQC